MKQKSNKTIIQIQKSLKAFLIYKHFITVFLPVIFEFLHTAAPFTIWPLIVRWPIKSL